MSKYCIPMKVKKIPLRKCNECNKRKISTILYEVHDTGLNSYISYNVCKKCMIIAELNINKKLKFEIIPPIVKKMVILEKRSNHKTEFFKKWIEMLKIDDYSCPLRYYWSKYINFDDLSGLWNKVKRQLNYNDYIKNWFINQIESIIKKRSLIKIIKKMIPYGKQIDELIITCSKCNRKMDLMMTKVSSYHKPHECPVCHKNYCVNCMNHVHIDTSAIGYIHGKSHSYTLEDTCINCLQDLKNTIGVLVNKEIKNGINYE